MTTLIFFFVEISSDIVKDRSPWFFWCFQGVEKGCIGNKWVNHIYINVEEVQKILQSFNQFQPNVAFNIGTSHLICNANQMTGFYMKRNTGLKKVRRSVYQLLFLSIDKFITKCDVYYKTRWYNLIWCLMPDTLREKCPNREFFLVRIFL